MLCSFSRLEFDASYWRPIVEATHQTVPPRYRRPANVRFDSARGRVIVSARINNCQKLFFVSKSIWVPQEDGENREAGEKPARSRHCDEISSYFSREEKGISKPGDLPRGFAALERFAERRSGRTGS